MLALHLVRNETMTESVAVLGAGAIGGPIGGLLTESGHNVVMIDQWPAHVDAMKSRGMRVVVGPMEAPERDFTVDVRAYHLCEVCKFKQRFGIVFLACKSYDTRWMTQLIEPHLESDGVLVSVQNSLNDEWIAPIVGNARDIGCVIMGGGELVEPGYVWRTRPMGHPYFMLGELDGRNSRRLEQVVHVLGDAGITRTTANIWGAKWSKLIYNCMVSALSALTGKRSSELIDDPRYMRAFVELGREASQVGIALGYSSEPVFGLTAEKLLHSSEEFVAGIVRKRSKDASEGRISMVQYDIRNGRPTEVCGYLNGLVVLKGKQASVPTPMNQAVTNLILRMERGELKEDISNLALLSGWGQ
jgi:2-dehydropantoate 2-reductase